VLIAKNNMKLYKNHNNKIPKNKQEQFQDELEEARNKWHEDRNPFEQKRDEQCHKYVKRENLHTTLIKIRKIDGT